MTLPTAMFYVSIYHTGKGHVFVKMENRKRPIALKLRVTEREHALIKEKMAQLGIQNQEAYLRKMAIDGYSVRLELPEVREMIVQLRKYGTNLNQLAKRANEGGSIFARDVERLGAEHAELYALTSALLRKLAEL